MTTEHPNESLIAEIAKTTKFSREEAIQMIDGVRRLKEFGFDVGGFLVKWYMYGMPQTMLQRVADIKL